MAYHVRIDLEGTTPPVWRLEVASDVFLDDVHEVIQIAFGWTDSHLHRFACGPAYYSGTPNTTSCPSRWTTARRAYLSAAMSPAAGSAEVPARYTVEIAHVSSRAVDRDCERRADGADLRLGQSAKAIHQHPDRDAFD